MAYYTQVLRMAKDPNNGTADMDMWVVWSDDDTLYHHGPYQVAYCPRVEDAERIKALLTDYGDAVPVTQPLATCDFCGQPHEDIQAQDMGEGRMMALCRSCRQYIADGIARELR